MAKRLALYGTIVHSQNIGRIDILENALICTGEDGIITALETNVPPDQLDDKLSGLNLNTEVYDLHCLRRGELLIPGFVDTHNHAPQWAQRGLGRGLQIIDWLNEITFKNEAKFANLQYARKVYTQAVKGFLKQGITTASYYASIHGPATKLLAEICFAEGQRALIGKCNMNRNSPPFYIEPSSQESLTATQEVIDAIKQIDPEACLIKPILTPRFAISCTEELLQGLGELATENPGLPIQTHFNEALSEIDMTLSLFPDYTNEADLYSHFGLLNDRTILAHCCHMTQYEIERLKQVGCGIAHCPIANTTVGGGFMAAPIRDFLRQGIIKIGLGTDSGGGFSSSILDAMRQAFIVSNAREKMTAGKDQSLTVDECFYMATLGGARVCGLDHKVGNFAVGKEFDACVVRTYEPADHDIDADLDLSVPLGVMTPIEVEDSFRTIFEKFVMSADDRNIARVWVRGKCVK